MCYGGLSTTVTGDTRHCFDSKVGEITGVDMCLRTLPVTGADCWSYLDIILSMRVLP